MRKIRQHNDIDIVVRLKDEQGVELDPTLNNGYNISVHTPSKKISITDYQLFDDGRIAFRFRARDQVRTGVYSITIAAKTSDGRVFTTDVCNAFALVTCSCETEKGSAEVELVTVEAEASFEITAWGGGGENTDLSLSGKINLTSIDEIKAAQSALSQTNEVAFYLVTDSGGKIPSSQECYDIPSDNVKQLSLTSPNRITNGVLALATSSVSINAVGVNVGDFVALTRVKVKVSDLAESIGVNISLSGEIEIYQYKILSMNDAKPTGHGEASAGVMGLMSPWDKGQVNKISGIESTANNALPKNDLLPSRWEANMNNALQTGVYPWCDLGRPAGSTGHYTCIVNKTSTDDGAFNTIEQTAYGREAELGQIYKRIIFEKTDGTDTQYGDWIKVSTDANGVSSGDIVPMHHAVILPSAEIVQIIDVSSPIGYSVIAVNEDVSECYAVPSYFLDGSIIVCDIDYTYVIGLDTDDEGNPIGSPIGSIAQKIPTKSQVYATKDEVASAISKAITTTLNTEV